MHEHIESRIEELKQEYVRGQARFHEVEVQQAGLRETLLRISGAIQVLEEVLAGGADASGSGGSS